MKLNKDGMQPERKLLVGARKAFLRARWRRRKLLRNNVNYYSLGPIGFRQWSNEDE